MYVGNLHSRLPYQAVHKELSADRLQTKKNFHSVYLRYFWLSVATRGRRRLRRAAKKKIKKKNPHFHQAVPL